MIRNRYFGSRDFYRRAMRVALPIMIQNGITNLVGMLDNIMVGRVGTDSMSGVAIVGQLMFIFNLCIFGGLAGIGIFTSQYYGSGDDDGIRYTVRMQVITAVLLTLLGTGLLLGFGDALIGFYLHSDGGIGNAQNTLHFAKSYLQVMLVGMLPFALGQMYSNTLRSTGETVIPMYAGLIAVVVNLVGNYILIYGKFGAPAMGVAGAALATVISRFVELFFVAAWTHLHTRDYPFIVGVYRALFNIPGPLVRQVTVRAMPLLLNETLWSGGQAMMNQCYSVRGLSVVAAINISSTISNVFNVSFIAMGSAVAIIVGQKLGAGEIEEAKDHARKLSAFTVLMCVGVGAALLVVAPLFPRIYNTSDEIRDLAAGLIRITAMFMPMYAYLNVTYFTVRSGGKTWIAFLLDSVFAWVFSVPFALFLAHFTAVPILPMFALVQAEELIKCGIGHWLIVHGNWAQNLTEAGE